MTRWWDSARAAVRGRLAAYPAIAPVARRFGLAMPVIALLSFFCVTGVRGVDFGRHWDEGRWQIEPIHQMLDSGILLPRSYIYPTFTKFLVLLPTIPAGLRAARHIAPDDARADGVKKAMLAVCDAPDYLLRIRRMFVGVSALAILWVYGASMALRGKRWEALLAASGLGLSWEYAYHSRWVATDCVLTQFAAMTLFALALLYRTQKPAWLYVAAVAAGLGTGTKYPGVVLLVPVLLAGALTCRPRTWLRTALRSVALCGIAFATYLVTTPATVLDPFVFVYELRMISGEYSRGVTHGSYWVATSWEHLKVIFLYFATSYFSPFPAVAVVLFVFALVGAVLWMRREPRVGAVLVGFPVAFVVFFATKYHVAIVRNYLLIVPFLAVLAARGVGAAFDRLSRVWLRRSFATVLTAALLVQGVWLARAAETIRHVDPDAEVRDAVAYVGRHPRTRFQLSSRVRAVAEKDRLVLPPNASDRPGADAVVLVAPSEGPGADQWKTNDPWLTEQVFGPLEVNFNWYATWIGKERVVVMSADKARDGGIVLGK